MSDIMNLLSYTFMQRAILCGIAISFSAALIGVILTLKNYSMIGHGLGEVGFAALSLAVALNLEPIAVSIPIVIIAAIIIMFISQKKGESADIIIALVATGALAIGVIITAFTSGFGTDSYNYMFGSILAMNTGDVILSIILTVLSIGIYIAFYNRLFLVTFDEKYAKTTGINVTFYQFLIALLTALVVVVGMRMMGTMLISSLIIFPAIIAKSIIYTNTIPAPVGIFKKNDVNIPIIKHTTEVSILITTKPLKLVVNFLAIIAGKTIKLDISIVPIILIPTTTTNAVNSAIKN